MHFGSVPTSCYTRKPTLPLLPLHVRSRNYSATGAELGGAPMRKENRMFKPKTDCGQAPSVLASLSFGAHWYPLLWRDVSSASEMSSVEKLSKRPILWLCPARLFWPLARFLDIAGCSTYSVEGTAMSARGVKWEIVLATYPVAPPSSVVLALGPTDRLTGV